MAIYVRFKFHAISGSLVISSMFPIKQADLANASVRCVHEVMEMERSDLLDRADFLEQAPLVMSISTLSTTVTKDID